MINKKNNKNRIYKAAGDVGGVTEEKKVKKIKSFEDGISSGFNEWLDQNNLPVTITYNGEETVLSPAIILWNCDPTLFGKIADWFQENIEVQDIPDDQSQAQEEVNKQPTGQVMPVEA